MRGGVSLAVWIGGAVAELDVLRRSRPGVAGPLPLGGNPDDAAVAARSRIYADLLAVAGYSAVEIDVLAGASAGGLNAVLYGVAQSAGASVEGLREDWMLLGDIGSLLRPAGWGWGRGFRRRAPSLLRGDACFLRRLAERLSGMLGGSATCCPPEPPDHLTITLSATVLPSPDVPLESHADEGRAYFHFVGRPAPPDSWISDIPRRGNGVGSPSVAHQIARLALAGRATSSFPAAFEPARVHSDDGHAREPSFHGTSHRDCPEMVGVFSAARPEDAPEHPFNVVDGGVFDNIPIARALRAITLSPAGEPTDRRLVYLDPDPPKPPPRRPTATDSEDGPVYGGIATIRRVLPMRQSNETELSDLEEIRSHNEAATARRAASSAYTCDLRSRLTNLDVAAVVAAVGTLTDPDDDLANLYVAHRVAADLPRLTELLLRPQQAAGRQVWFTHLVPVRDRRALLGRRLPLRDCYAATEATASPDLRHDLTAVAATAEFLIGWARAGSCGRARSPSCSPPASARSASVGQLSPPGRSRC